MKKITIILVTILLLLSITGCNRQVMNFNYTYDKAVCVIADERFELAIDKWKDNGVEQIQIIAKDGNTYLFSMNNCYLMKD